MKRISLAEKCLWYLAALSILTLGGCAAMDRAFTPSPDGSPPPAQTVLQSIGAAVSTLNPAVGAALVAAGAAVGGVAVHKAGKKSAKSKTATPPIASIGPD